MYHIFLIHSLVEGLLGCFEILAMTNNASMNIVEHLFLWYKCLTAILDSSVESSLFRSVLHFLLDYLFF